MTSVDQAASTAAPPVRRLASITRLRPEREAEYRALHAEVWPEILDAMTAANIRNFSIYLRDGLLFSYSEYVGDDYEHDMARLGATELSRRWFEVTDPCQEALPTAVDGQKWSPAEEIFHLH